MASKKSLTMLLRCPKCSATMEVSRHVRKMPEHHDPDVLKTWAKVDGETQMFDIWRRCGWSGAKIRVVKR